MKAELNENNEVVVTMSRCDAQRLAESSECYDGPVISMLGTAMDFSCVVQELGIELWLQK